MSFRSNTYKEIFKDDEMLKAFGTLTPSVSQRTAYFFEQWMDWRSNRIKFDQRVNSSKRDEIRTILKQFGLSDPWDYQFKNNEVRFKDAESMAFFKIAAGKANG